MWLVLYFYREDLHKEMFFASFLAAPLGLLEAFFVPWYWEPNSLLIFRIFNFQFDIESIIFSFAVGGIAAVLYEVFLKKHLKKERMKKKEIKKHYSYLIIALIAAFAVFGIIFNMDLIYASIVAMAIGAATIIFSRKDLIKETIIGGFLFLGVYFCLLLALNTFVFPDWIARTWNFEHIWGITFLKIPLEEILWALAFGALWAPIYEDVRGYAVK